MSVLMLAQSGLASFEVKAHENGHEIGDKPHTMPIVEMAHKTINTEKTSSLSSSLLST